MSILIGHASISEKGTANGEKGDTTKKEVCIRKWYSKPWDFIAIHPDANVREKHAKAVEAACANDNIGYGRSDRNSLNKLAKEVNYDLSKVGLCNCDCSSLQNVAAVASGAPGVSYKSWVTANMKDHLKAAGYIIITESEYLKNAEYCVRGAIYVKAGSHTVCGLTNGKLSEKTLAKAGLLTTASKPKAVENDNTKSKVEAATKKDSNLKGTYIVTAAALNLRSGAGTGKPIILSMPKGSKVQCYGYYNEIDLAKWLYVSYNGTVGYASFRYLKKQ